MIISTLMCAILLASILCCTNAGSSREGKTSSAIDPTASLIQKTNDQVDQQVRAYGTAQELIYKTDEEWRKRYQEQIKAQDETILKTLGDIEKMLDYKNPIKLEELNRESLVDQMKDAEQHAQAATKIAELLLTSKREASAQAGLVQQRASEALIVAQNAVEEARREFERAEEAAKQAQAHMDATGKDLETAREAEATAQTELDKQKEVEKEAQARLPELHQKFLKIEEAQEKKEQIDMAIRADVGRYEELSRPINAAQRLEQELLQVSRKKVLLIEIQNMTDKYNRIINNCKKFVTALDIKPMVPIRQKIYYLATNYFGITQATIDAAMAKARLTLEPESVKSRKVNLFKQNEKSKKPINNEEDLVSLVAYGLQLYEKMKAKMTSSNQPEEDIERDVMNMSQLQKEIDNYVNTQIKLEKADLGIREFPVQKLKANKMIKGKEKMEEEEDQTDPKSAIVPLSTRRSDSRKLGHILSISRNSDLSRQLK